MNANAGLHLTGWEQFGSAGTMEMSASGRRVFFTEDRVDPRAYLTQDVLLPADAGGKWLVLAGYGWVERTLEGSITRHPYLYGYEMLSDREIAAYLQGQDMRHEAESRTWETMSGIFQLGPSPYQIRMFLNQAAMVGDAPDGARAAFDDLQLRLFDSRAAAEQYLDSYRQAHPVLVEGP